MRKLLTVLVAVLISLGVFAQSASAGNTGYVNGGRYCPADPQADTFNTPTPPGADNHTASTPCFTASNTYLHYYPSENYLIFATGYYSIPWNGNNFAYRSTFDVCTNWTGYNCHDVYSGSGYSGSGYTSRVSNTHLVTHVFLWNKFPRRYCFFSVDSYGNDVNVTWQSLPTVSCGTY